MPTARPRKSGSDTLSNFAYVDSTGKGHLPLSKNGTLDAGHVRNALARFNQTHFESASAKQKALTKIHAAAKSLGIATSSAHQVREEVVCGLVLEICAATAAGAPPPEWIDLIPAGEFVLADGRGPFVNDDPEGVIAATLEEIAERGLTGGIPFDYDHSTDFAAPDGHPSPASGWMKEFKVQAGAVWAHVEWTARAATAIAAKEYKYISPVFNSRCDACGNTKCTTENPCTSGTRHVTRVLRAGLTNNPAMTDLQAIAAGRRSDTMKGLTLTRAQLGKVVGIVHARAVQAAEGAPLSEIAKTVEKAFPHLSRGQVAQLIEFIEQLEGNPDDPEAVEGDGDETPELTAREGHASDCASEVCEGECLPPEAAADEEMAAEHAAAMHDGDGEPTEEELAAARAFVARHRQIAAAHAAKEEPVQIRHRPSRTRGDGDKDKQIMTLAAKVESLEAEGILQKVTAVVDAAIAAHKVTPACRASAISWAKRDLKEFREFVGKAPVLVRPGVDLTAALPAVTGAAGRLDKRTLAICAAQGVKPEDYLKYIGEHREESGSTAAFCAVRLGHVAP